MPAQPNARYCTSVLQISNNKNDGRSKFPVWSRHFEFSSKEMQLSILDTLIGYKVIIKLLSVEMSVRHVKLYFVVLT